MLISVVTPCLNRVDMIVRAIESVPRSGEGWEVEHIIIDGGSTDGTRGALANYEHLQVVSEPDDGIYDAMNKGFGLARGELVCIVNSDDWLEPGALDKVAGAWINSPDAEIISGGANVVAPDGRVTTTFSDPADIGLSLENVTFGTPMLNARFFTRALLARSGMFNSTYKVSADVDLLARMAILNPHEVIIPEVLYNYLEHDGSATINATSPQGRTAALECLRIAEVFMADKKITPTVREHFRIWHACKTALLIKQDLVARRLHHVILDALSAMRVSIVWPLNYLKRKLGQAS